MNQEKTLIIVPSYHEEKNIHNVIKGLKEYVPDFDILIIDDGSKDKTHEIALDNGVKVISHPFNMGYGVAIQTGFKYAVRQNYDFVIQFDGDDQHDPRFIKPMMKCIKDSQTDIVIGSRFLEDKTDNVPFIRKSAIKFFSLIASLITRQRFTDSTSGFQVINRATFTFFSKMDNFPYDYPDADLIITLCSYGFRVKECPVIMHNRMHGQSMTAGFKSLIYIVKMLISIFITLIRKKKIVNGYY